MADGEGTGGGAPNPAEGAGGGTPNPAEGAGGGTPNPAPTSFDWKAHGIDEKGQALIHDRGWKGPGDVLESYTNLEKLTGVPPEQIVKIPKNNDPAEWDAVYNKLGRPEKADAYNLPVPEGDSGDFAKTASEWFHKAGLSEASGRKLAEQWNEFNASTQQAREEEHTAFVTSEVGELKNSWGDQYQANTEIVDRAAAEFGMSDEQLQSLKAAMGPKAAMEFMYNIGSKIATEDREFFRNPDGSASFNGMSPEIARGEIARLKADQSFSAQFVSQDPKVRQEARDKMSRLNKIAYPHGS